MRTRSEHADVSSETRPPREVGLIVNLRSRSGSSAARAALYALERQGLRVRRSHLVRTGAGLMLALRSVLDSGLRTIVIGGGDGTLTSAVDYFAYRPELTLGLLPMGTGNTFARTLGIPSDMAGAARVIADGHVRLVDLAQMGSTFFLHTAMVGYGAHANHTTPNWLKAMFGEGAYLYSTIAAMLGTRTFRARVEAGDFSWEGSTGLVVVGNAYFHEPARVLLPPSIVPESGLVVYGPRYGGTSTMLRLANALWIARRPEPELLFYAAADDVTVTADPVQDVDLDGEHSGFTPAQFRAAPGALRVLVPGPPED